VSPLVVLLVGAYEKQAAILPFGLTANRRDEIPVDAPIGLHDPTYLGLICPLSLPVSTSDQAQQGVTKKS